MPMKIVTSVNINGTQVLDKLVPKSILKYTDEYEREVQKDKKTQNILFNGTNKDIFVNVIKCIT